MHVEPAQAPQHPASYWPNLVPTYDPAPPAADARAGAMQPEVVSRAPMYSASSVSGPSSSRTPGTLVNPIGLHHSDLRDSAGTSQSQHPPAPDLEPQPLATHAAPSSIANDTTSDIQTEATSIRVSDIPFQHFLDITRRRLAARLDDPKGLGLISWGKRTRYASVPIEHGEWWLKGWRTASAAPSRAELQRRPEDFWCTDKDKQTWIVRDDAQGKKIPVIENPYHVRKLGDAREVARREVAEAKRELVALGLTRSEAKHLVLYKLWNELLSGDNVDSAGGEEEIEDEEDDRKQDNGMKNFGAPVKELSAHEQRHAEGSDKEGDMQLWYEVSAADPTFAGFMSSHGVHLPDIPLPIASGSRTTHGGADRVYLRGQPSSQSAPSALPGNSTPEPTQPPTQGQRIDDVLQKALKRMQASIEDFSLRQEALGVERARAWEELSPDDRDSLARQPNALE